MTINASDIKFVKNVNHPNPHSIAMVIIWLMQNSIYPLQISQIINVSKWEILFCFIKP